MVLHLFKMFTPHPTAGGPTVEVKTVGGLYLCRGGTKALQRFALHSIMDLIFLKGKKILTSEIYKVNYNIE